MNFSSIRTERLLLRTVRATDTEALVARRSDPAVAEYQNWVAPYPRERAEASVAGTMAMDGPSNDEWWMLTVATSDDAEVLGDLVVHLTGEGRTAEIGYTFAQTAWGQGYALEATRALVDWLWSHPEVTRVHAMLHPDNVASAQVLERVGMVFEGHTRLSFWVGDENSDDWFYGMTRAEHDAWTTRQREAPRVVRLAEVTRENVATLRALRTHKTQERFVAPVENAFMHALFPPLANGAPYVPFLRGIEADGELVGFVMMTEPTEHHEEPILWRLLIDRMHQRRGIGTEALELAINEARAMGAPSLLVSWVPGRGSPAPLYLQRGFEPTGTIGDGEVEARLML